MQWQVDRLGIVVGYAASLAFYNVRDTSRVVGLNWRLMMDFALLPAVIVCCFVFLCPESRRLYMQEGQHAQAFMFLSRLRFSKSRLLATSSTWSKVSKRKSTSTSVGARSARWSLYQEIAEQCSLLRW